MALLPKHQRQLYAAAELGCMLVSGQLPSSQASSSGRVWACSNERVWVLCSDRVWGGVIGVWAVSSDRVWGYRGVGSEG